LANLTSLVNMKQWLVERTEENNKKLLQWQMEVTFVGIFISITAGVGLFFISKPLAISALMLVGLSFITPLFFQSVPFSNDAEVMLAATKIYEKSIADVLAGMNFGINRVSFVGSVLENEVKLRAQTSAGTSEIFMREVDGDIKFFNNDKILVSN
jgi:hypothetical protein